MEHVLLDLNRPEYNPSPEGLLSDLAWSVADEQTRERLVYEHATGQAKTTATRKPEEEGVFLAALEDAGIVFSERDVIATAFLDSFRGVLPQKASAYPVVPLVPSLALMQNGRGIRPKPSPANYAKIIEQLYTMGSPSGTKPRAAAAKWLGVLMEPEACKTLEQVAEATSKIGPVADGRASLASIRARLQSGPDGPDNVRPAWLTHIDTPFAWFRRNWDRLCTLEWRNAMPRRRWCDWATCVLRTAIGMGFLWEARLFLRLGSHLACLQGYEASSSLLDAQEPLLEWKLPKEAISDRDVGGPMRHMIRLGVLMRAALGRTLEEQGLQGLFNENRAIDDVLAPLKNAVSNYQAQHQINPLLEAVDEPPNRPVNNMHETILYSLLRRVEVGRDADFYSLLARRSRRFLVVEPGPEWIVVIASLAADRPRQQTTLRQVNIELNSLGLRPPREILVRELERAGLARSSHDSDEALEVASAF